MRTTQSACRIENFELAPTKEHLLDSSSVEANDKKRTGEGRAKAANRRNLKKMACHAPHFEASVREQRGSTLLQCRIG